MNIYNSFKYVDKTTLDSMTKDELLKFIQSNYNISKSKYDIYANLDKTKLIEEYYNLHCSEINKKIKAIKLSDDVITEYSKETTKSALDTINDATQNVKDEIHNIHNFIRNKGFGYGMTGLKVFNMIYGLLQIEKSGILNDYIFGEETLQEVNMTSQELKDKLNFSKIYKSIENYKPELMRTDDEWAFDKSITDICNLLYKFKSRNDNKIKNLIYYDLTRLKYSCEDLQKLFELIVKVNKFTESKHIQLGGKIYEYFIGRDQSAISELGAYFTDRHLVNYIFENMLEIDNLDVNNVPNMIDMFGGSGGFTINYIVKINKLLEDYYRLEYSGYDEKMIDIKIKEYWKNNIRLINHKDVNGDVVNNARLEAFCLTKQLISSHNFGVFNSFTHSFGNDKYKLIISNPPYGGDKCGETDEIKDYKKIIDYNKKKLEKDFNFVDAPYLLFQNNVLEQNIKYIKEQQKTDNVNYKSCSKTIKDLCDKIVEFENEYRQSKQIKTKAKKGDSFNDKESCSFALLMALCAPGGRVIGVLKEGVFFDSKYAHIRRYLLTHFIVKRVDSNPADTFENTTTKTSNILFELPEDGVIPDDYNIEFYDVEVIKNTTDVFDNNNKFTNLKATNNGTIKDVISKKVTVVSSKDILATDKCSLNAKQYNKVSLVPGDGFKMVKLGDVCDIKRGNKLNKDLDLNNKGKYPVYGAGKLIGYSDKFNRDNNFNIIISRVGGNNSKDCCKLLNGKLLLTDAAFSIKNNNILNYYLGYYLYYNYDKIFSYYSSGSVQMTISQNVLQNIELPIPKTEEQINYWVNYISEPYNALPKQEELYNTRLEELRKAAIKA